MGPDVATLPSPGVGTPGARTDPWRAAPSAWSPWWSPRWPVRSAARCGGSRWPANRWPPPSFPATGWSSWPGRSARRPLPPVDSVVAVADPRDPSRILVKRVVAVDHAGARFDVRGDNPGGEHRQPGVRTGPAARRWWDVSSTGTPPQAAPAPVPGPRGTIDGDAEHPGRPQPPPRPDLPRRRRRAVARRHPPHARRVPGGRRVALLPAPTDPGAHGHRPRLPRTSGGHRTPPTCRVWSTTWPGSSPAPDGRRARGATPSSTRRTPTTWPG